jgi:hypothetical protein
LTALLASREPMFDGLSMELGPRQITVSASPRQLASPDPSRSLPKLQEAVERSGMKDIHILCRGAASVR